MEEMEEETKSGKLFHVHRLEESILLKSMLQSDLQI
jgi:hypothetical protein